MFLRPLSRAIAVLLSCVVLAHVSLADAAQVSVWTERRSNSPSAAPTSSALSDSSVPKAPESPLDRVLLALPPQFGTVRSVHEPAGPSRGVVVAISDIHGNPEAQDNIGRAIESLARAGIHRLALEGAAGPLDISPLRRIDRRHLSRIATYLERRDDISGPVSAALRSSIDLSLHGIDDAALHRANADAYRRSLTAAPGFNNGLRRLADALAIERRTFPSDLAALDDAVTAYHAGRTTIGEHLTTLTRVAGRLPDNVDLFLKALAIERRLDNAAVERERRAVLERLGTKASREQLALLLNRTASFRTGRIKSGAYYAHIRELCASAGVPLERFPAMNDYVRYVALADRVDGATLLDETSDLERSAYDRLATTEALKKVVASSRWSILAGKLSTFELTRSDWADFRSLPWPALAPSQFDAEPFLAFYDLAGRRDAALSANAAAFINDGGIIVTGGFHGDSVRSDFVRNGWTVVDFTPRLTRISSGSGYLSVFAREKTPVEKLFAGDRLFLKSDPLPPSMRLAVIPATAIALDALEGNPVDAEAALAVTAPDSGITDATVTSNGEEATVQITRDEKTAGITVERNDAGDILSITEGGGGNDDGNASAATREDEPFLIRDGRVYRAEEEGIPLPSYMELIRRGLDDATADDLGNRILEIVARRQLGTAQAIGRTFVLYLPEPVTVGGRTFNRLVMKGVTLNGGLPEARPWAPGPEDAVTQPNFFLETSASGEAWLTPVRARPAGTTYLINSAREFTEMTRAHRLGNDAPLPIGLGLFPGMTLEDLQLGFMVYLDNHDGGGRVSMDFENRYMALNGLPNRAQNEGVIRVTNEFLPYARRIGRTLRRLHERQIHHAPYLGQFGMAERDGLQRLYDFDGSIAAETLTAEEFAFWRLEDILYTYGSIHGLVQKIGGPGMDPVMLHVHLIPGMGIHASPLDEFIRGYFTPEELADGRILSLFAPQDPLLTDRLRGRINSRQRTPIREFAPELTTALEDLFSAEHSRAVLAAINEWLASAHLPQLPPDASDAISRLQDQALRLHEAGLTLSPEAVGEGTSNAFTPEQNSAIAAALGSFAEGRKEATLPVLMVPWMRTLLAWIFWSYHALSGERWTMSRAHTEAEAITHRRWFIVSAVPAIELIGLPGFSIALASTLLPLLPLTAPFVAALLGGAMFGLIHGLPGRHQSWRAFTARSAISAVISIISLALWMSFDGGLGVALSLSVAYLSHSLWNALVSDEYILATNGGWRRRLENLINRLKQPASAPLAYDELRRFMETVVTSPALRIATWKTVTDAIPTMIAGFQEDLAMFMLTDAFDHVRRRGFGKSPVEAIVRLLGLDLSVETRNFVWEAVALELKGSTDSFRQDVLPAILPLILERLDSAVTRNIASSDLKDIVSTQMGPEPRTIVIGTLTSALTTGTLERRQAILGMIGDFARVHRRSRAVIVELYGHVRALASDKTAPPILRTQALTTLHVLYELSGRENAAADFARDVLEVIRNEEEPEVAIEGFSLLERVREEIGDDRLTARIALAAIDALPGLDPANVINRIRLIHEIFQNLDRESQRRSLLRAVIARLPAFEEAFARTPESLGRVGSMLGNWVWDNPGELSRGELDLLADHVARTYGLVGKFNELLLLSLTNLGIFTETEAKERILYSNWDLSQERMQREPIRLSFGGYAVEVVGRLDLKTPGRSYVQAPSLRLEFKQSSPTGKRWSRFLPDDYHLGSAIEQEGRTLMFFPARLVGGEHPIELMAFLGEPARPRDPVTRGEVEYDVAMNRERTIVRAWIPYRIGGAHFVRPAIAIGNPSHWRTDPDIEPSVTLLGHSADLRWSYYFFAETGVVYRREMNTEERRRLLREIDSARDDQGGRFDIEQQQEYLTAREHLLSALSGELESLTVAEATQYLAIPTDLEARSLVQEIRARNPDLVRIIFPGIDMESADADEITDAIDRFSWSRHAADLAKVADLNRAYYASVNAHYVPSLGVAVSREGREWLVERAVQLLPQRQFNPHAPDLAEILDEIAGRRPVLDPRTPATLRLFSWLRTPYPATNQHRDYLERLLMTPMQQLQATLATLVKLRFTGTDHEFVADESNFQPASYLGEALRLGEAILPEKTNAPKSPPTHVQVTIPGRNGRTVFFGDSSPRGTLKTVIESIPNAISSVRMIRRVILIRPYVRERVIYDYQRPAPGRQLKAKIQSGDALRIELKKERRRGNLDLLANVFAAGILVAALAIYLGVADGTHLALAGIAIALAVLVHEAWHYAAARLLSWVEGTGAPAPTVSVGRAISVSWSLSSPVSNAIATLAALSAIPLALLLGGLLSGDARTIAIVAVIAVNVFSLIPLKTIAPGIGAETDGDLLLSILYPKKKPETPEETAARAAADGIQALVESNGNRAMFSEALTRLSEGMPISLRLDDPLARRALASGESLLLDDEAYAAALYRELTRRGLPTDLDRVRANLQAIALFDQPSRPFELALSRTELVDRQASVVTLPANLDRELEKQVLILLEGRQSANPNQKFVLTAENEAQASRLRALAPTLDIVPAPDAFGQRDGQNTLEIAPLVKQLAAAGIDLNSFSGVRFIAPAGRTIVMEGLSDDLPWISRAVVLIIDEALRAAETQLQTLHSVEKIARLVAKQA